MIVRLDLQASPSCIEAFPISIDIGTTGSDRQSGFRKTVSNPLDVFFVLEGLPGEMLDEGVFWIDFFEFTSERRASSPSPR